MFLVRLLLRCLLLPLLLRVRILLQVISILRLLVTSALLLFCRFILRRLPVFTSLSFSPFFNWIPTMLDDIRLLLLLVPFKIASATTSIFLVLSFVVVVLFSFLVSFVLRVSTLYVFVFPRSSSLFLSSTISSPSSSSSY